MKSKYKMNGDNIDDKIFSFYIDKNENNNYNKGVLKQNTILSK